MAHLLAASGFDQRVSCVVARARVEALFERHNERIEVCCRYTGGVAIDRYARGTPRDPQRALKSRIESPIKYY